MALQSNPAETAVARAQNPGIDLEVLWDGMWIRRIGSHFLPDPEFLQFEDRNWSKWLSRVDKYLYDANEYWFHVYKPSPGDTIVDIGAGRGEDVFAFSRAVGPQGKVWAIEPHPVSYAALVKLCELNGLANVTALNVACVDAPATLQIETLPVWESNYIRDGEATPTSHTVTGVRFDSLAAEHEIHRIDFIKMNIEGAERAALPGCRQAFGRARYACIAAHDFRADRGEGEQFRTFDLVQDFLTGAGFTLITRRDDPRYYVKYHLHAIAERRPGLIADEQSLRDLYGNPIERARLKSLRKLDRHCRNFIQLSPFVCLGTQGPAGADVTPRGDQPGFVQALDDVTLAIPDWPGNNRLDSLVNLLSNPRIGLLFMVPGVDETLRVNGSAQITTDKELLARWNVNGRHPKSALIVTVSEAFLHCGKALIRSRLWHNDYKIERNQLPSYGQMMKDQIEISDSAEQIEVSVADGYKNKLY